MVNCPKESRDNRNPQSNSKGRSAAPPSTQDRGRGRAGQSQHRGRGGTVSEIVDRLIPTTPTQAYSMKARGDQNFPEVLASKFSFF